MKERIHQIITPNESDTTAGKFYDTFMIIVIFVSIIPIFFKKSTGAFTVIEYVTVTIFIIDYLARWYTADIRYNGSRLNAYIKYPFTVMAIIDLLSVLPTITVTNSSFKLLKTLRVTRSIRVMRVFKSLRYSKNFILILKVMKKTKSSLSAVAILCVVYVMASALIIFNIEPDTFENYFEAIYWATVSLTTVGYGDIYPVSTIGRMVTMLSAIFGIAIVALPAGIITAGFMSEIEN